jgi:hypothetical protein
MINVIKFDSGEKSKRSVTYSSRFCCALLARFGEEAITMSQGRD